MKSKLTAYFRFDLDESNPRFLTLFQRYGTFVGLKGIESKVMKLQFTYSCKFFLQVQNTGVKHAKLRLLNTLEQKRNGVAHFDSLPDAVLAIFNPKASSVELFIAPGQKGYSYILYQQFLTGEIEQDMLELRKKAQSVV